jgi:CRP-like cAMP-binding protein
MRTIPCAQCPFRALPHALRDVTPREPGFISSLKCGEFKVEAGNSILAQGTNSAYLFALVEGWAFRYKMLPDGRRQILNYALPGDFIGFQSLVFDEMDHSAEALTDAVLCTFPHEKLREFQRRHPNLAFDLVWLAAREVQILDENLLSIGRRTALERMAYLLLHLFLRARQAGLATGGRVRFPLSQQHIADTLGLSLVHTNKTIKRLKAAATFRWHAKDLEIADVGALARIACYAPAEQ